MITNGNHDEVFGSDGPEVEPTLLLQYLIEKSEELSHKNFTGFPLPFRAFGVGALGAFPELQKEFTEITARSEEPVNERAEKCKQLFIEALARPLESNAYASKGGEDHPSDRVITTRFAWFARREGEEMVEKNDFRFLPVWMCMTFIALHTDAEKLKEFEQTCRQFPDPEQKIEQMIPILWEVLRAKMRRN